LAIPILFHEGSNLPGAVSIRKIKDVRCGITSEQPRLEQQINFTSPVKHLPRYQAESRRVCEGFRFQREKELSEQVKADTRALPYCLSPDVSIANETSDCIQKIEKTTEVVIATVEVIAATKGVLIDAALRTAAEAIRSRRRPILGRPRTVEVR
jgi:hypothetical protein